MQSKLKSQHKRNHTWFPLLCYNNPTGNIKKFTFLINVSNVCVNVNLRVCMRVPGYENKITMYKE